MPLPPMFNGLPIPILLMDLQGLVLDANPSARRFFNGAVPAGRSLPELLMLGRASVPELTAFLTSDAETASMFLEGCVGPKGEERSVEILLCRSGPGQALAFLRDVTQARREKEHALLVDRLASIGKLAGGMAHDLNNILMVITSYAALLEKKLPKSGVETGFLQEIKKAAGRAVTLADQLLAFARRQALQPKPLDLTRFIQDRRESIAAMAGPNAAVELILSAHLPVVEADPVKLNLVLEHLTSNARDALPEKGNIIIETAEFIGDPETLAPYPLMPPGRYVSLAFTDTGTGMPPEIRDRIFEPFFTTKPKGKGTGMGMAMVYGIVKQSGGYIYCSSEPGIGTTVQIFLPAAAEPAPGEPEPAKVEAAETDGRGRTILVIEDEQALLSSIGMILKNAGFDVLAADSGESALKTMEGLPRPPDLIISDVILPGMDGKQTVDQILAMKPGIPVIYMSGFSDTIIGRHGIVPKDIHYLPKPFDVETLLRKMREAMGS